MAQHPAPDGSDAASENPENAAAERQRVVDAALAALDLDAKAGLLAGQDTWTLPAIDAIGLGSLVLSDGPVGVRGRRWTPSDPSVALPSPTALAAVWDPDLARRAGRLLAQEAHRKGVHVLLAPTVNLHRSPLGGRHFEAYSEDPYLTGVIGTGFVRGVQDGGIGVTVKHFVGNDAETDRFTVDNRIPERALRELYLAPFEAIVTGARPWGVMAGYNAVNGVTMTEHRALVQDVLRRAWGFDGVVVSDWFAARSTAGALHGGLDLAMPGPVTVYGPALAAAVRAGELDEALVDAAARRVLLLAARAGLLAGAPPAVPAAARPPALDGPALARELAARACVLLRNEPRDGVPVLPLTFAGAAEQSGPAAIEPPGGPAGQAARHAAGSMGERAAGARAVGLPAAGQASACAELTQPEPAGPSRGGESISRQASASAELTRPAPAGPSRGSERAPRRGQSAEPAAADGIGGVAVIGAAARDVRALGGGSAQVFPERVSAPLDALRAALPAGTRVTYAAGADPSTELAAAAGGFTLHAVVRDAAGRETGGEPLPGGQVMWLGDLPDGVAYDALHTVEIRGAFVPRVSGPHRFGTRGTGAFTLTVAGRVLFDGVQADPHSDPFEAFIGAAAERGTVELTVGRPVEVSLLHTPRKAALPLPVQAVACALLHGEPALDAEELLDEAEAAARAAHTAIVVVGTTERVESEGFDRADLRLPGRQDDLVARVAAANSRTVVVVNAGAPVEMPWREDVAAILLAWFPGQEAGAALADVLLGAAEPGGRLPTTWPARLADAPVTRVTPEGGRLPYDEGLFIGYRGWDRAAADGSGPAPAYCFGHGLGYTRWAYTGLALEPGAPGPDRGDVLATVTVTLRNAGPRAGREIVQVYLAPETDGPVGPVERPRRWLAGFAAVTAEPGEQAVARIELPRRAAQFWSPPDAAWRTAPGRYRVHAAHSLDDVRLTAVLDVPPAR